MQLTKQFKILLLALLTMSILSTAVGIILVHTLPSVLQDYISKIDNEFYSSAFGILDIFTIIIGIFAIAVIIGVWKFKNWARHSYVLFTIIFLPYYYIDGPIIMNPLEAIFNDLSLIIDGILICMMYMTPLSNEFKLKDDKN
ncbi:MAG TPA: hypothetical protein EYO73_05455 [Sulfurimonas sp.]|nr:hypothetical protein [Sulfurimonas sp.]